MSTNITDLGYVYKKIFVLNMFEKLKDCAINWAKVSQTQYSTVLSVDGIVWDINLVYMPNQSSVVLDFVKDNQVIYSTSSDDDIDVYNLYNEIDLYEESLNEDLLLQDIQKMKGCDSGEVYDEVAQGGIKASGSGDYFSDFTVPILG